MSGRFDPNDPRYQERFTAAMELLRMWRNLVQSSRMEPRNVILPGSALNTVVKWTDDFLSYPASDTDESSQMRELS